MYWVTPYFIFITFIELVFTETELPVFSLLGPFSNRYINIASDEKSEVVQIEANFDPNLGNRSSEGTIILKPSDEKNGVMEDAQSRQTGGTCSCGIRNFRRVIRSSRIVGGVAAQFGEIPWRVAVYIFNKAKPNGGSICGGTIISRNWILTAAHCTRIIRPGVHTVHVYVGAQTNPVTVGGGLELNVDKYIQNPTFNYGNFDGDIALLHLQTPLKFGATVSPACLPFGSLSQSNFQGARVLASGWGTTKPVRVNQQNRNPTAYTLRKAVLPLLTTAQCSRFQRVTKNQICTYQVGKDTCQGDSGGSIDFMNHNGVYYTIGVVSHGYGCAQRRRPGVYTKVNNYLSWIQQATGEIFCKP